MTLFGEQMPPTQPLPACHAVQPGVQPFQGGPLPQRVPAPPPPPLPPQVVPMSGSAACAFVLGLLAFVTFGATGIPAVIVGVKARFWTRNGFKTGNGLACVGIMLGWFAIAGWVLFWVLLTVGLAGALGGDR